MWIGYCKEIRKLTLRALALRRSEAKRMSVLEAYTVCNASKLAPSGDEGG